MHQKAQDSNPRIKVIVRKRPLNKKELLRGETDIVAIRDGTLVAVSQEKMKVDLTKYMDEYAYNFDAAFDQFTTNQALYNQAIRPLIDSAFGGAKVTCFAYGQTGSGKTFTMLGYNNIPGLYLLASHDIFRKLPPTHNVWISYYEIYCGKLYDLLNQRTQLFAREDAKQNVHIVGLQEQKVASVESLMQVIAQGNASRVTAQNSANADSSRSHAILQICIKSSSKSVPSLGRISFIDLAGSERGADHADESKQTRVDGAEINKSLLALKQCIRALDQNKNHTPFRGSKLTMVLKDSFSGYSRCVMIGNISPGNLSCQNTLNTLKYAYRVKQLKKGGREANQKDELMLPRGGKENKYNISDNFFSSLAQQQDPDAVDAHQFSPGQAEGVDPREDMQQRYPQSYSNQNTDSYNHSNFNSINFKSNNSNPKKGINVIHRPVNAVPNVRNTAATDNRDFQSLFPKSIAATQQQALFPRSTAPEPSTQAYHQPPYLSSHRQSVSRSHNYPQQYIPSEADMGALSRRHEELVDRIIQQEGELLAEHKQHINRTVSTVKGEGNLLSEFDNESHDISDYLNHLEQMLLRKATSIAELQKRIYDLKTNVNQSKQIEQIFNRNRAISYSRHPDDLVFDGRETEQNKLFNY